MLNKQYQDRAAKILLVAIPIAMMGIAKSANAEMETLFTTPQERQIINANRYKIDGIVKPPVEATTVVFVAPVAQEEVSVTFVISGITVSDSGPHSVWINNQVYEDGEHLEDDSHIRVLTDNHIRVKITTPDGKNYYGTSGEVIEATYLAVVGNQP